MKISESYKSGNFRNGRKKSLSFEIFPPKKDSELKNIDETLGVLCILNQNIVFDYLFISSHKPV